MFPSEPALYPLYYIFSMLFTTEFPAHTKGAGIAGRVSKTGTMEARLGLGSIYLPWHFKGTWFVCTNLAVIRCKDFDRSMQAWCIGKQFTCKITSLDNSTSFGRSVIMLSGGSWFVYNMHAIKYAGMESGGGGIWSGLRCWTLFTMQCWLFCTFRVLSRLCLIL